MNKSKCLYLNCRLCAVLMPFVGLVDLQANECKRKNILNKLSRLGISVTDLESEHDILPKTICSACMSSLNKAYSFAVNVQIAQEVLNKHILAQNLRKQNDCSLSYKGSICDLPSIVEKNGGILILSPSSIQEIVKSSSKYAGVCSNPNLYLNKDYVKPSIISKNINEKVVEKSENSPSITQSIPTTEVPNINEIQIETKLYSDPTDIEMDIKVFEEHTITVTDYQITNSNPKSHDIVNNGKNAKEGINKEEVIGEATPGLFFDFEEENIDENSEIEDNCFDTLKTQPNLGCNENEVESSDIAATLLDFQEEIDEESELINENNVQTRQIEVNLSGSNKKNLVENATKTDINIEETQINTCKRYETQKVHNDEFMTNHAETLSEAEVQIDELEHLKHNIFKDFINGIPVVVLNRISDAEETLSEAEVQIDELEHLKHKVFKDFINGIPVVVLNRISDADEVSVTSNTTKTISLQKKLQQEPELAFQLNESQVIPETSDCSDKNRTKSNEELVTSESMSWKEYRWKCYFCKEKFPHIDNLIAHSKELHGHCNSYECTGCGIQYFELDSFITHLQSHMQHLKFSCFRCFKKYPYPHQVQLHYKTHAKSNLKCLGCHEVFSKIEDLEKHFTKYKPKNTNADSGIKIYADGLSCKICEKACSNLRSLQLHLENIHSVGKKRFECGKCGKRYHQYQPFISHVKLHNIVCVKSQCKFCPDSLKDGHDLRSHLYEVHGKKHHTCDYCGKKFKVRSSLRQHLLFHTGFRPYKCDICKKDFKLRNQVKKHILEKHNKVDPKAHM